MMDQAIKAPERKPYFAAIDGMRSLCVLFVMSVHLKSNGHGPLFFNGYLGVDIFFVISGFLISTLLLREEKITGKIDLSAFYWRRAFRIIPIYSFVLLMYVVICQLPSQAAKWISLKGGLPYFLLFMNEYVHEPNNGNVFTHTWSLGVEEKFYLFWPVLFFVLIKRTRGRSVLLLGISLLLALIGYAGYSQLVFSYFGLLMGCIMALLLSGEIGDGFSRGLGKIPSPVMLFILIVGFYLHQINHGFITVFSVTVVLFLSYLIVRPTWMSAILSSRPLVWLGRRSYSMYLVHVLCLHVFEDRFPIHSFAQAALVLLASYALTAAVAGVLFETIEEPARRYGKRFITQRQARMAALDTSNAAAG